MTKNYKVYISYCGEDKIIDYIPEDYDLLKFDNDDCFGTLQKKI